MLFKVKRLERPNKTLESCIVAIVYFDSLSPLFSFKYCYGIRLDQLNMNNIKHCEKIKTHTQITKKNTMLQGSGLLTVFSKRQYVWQGILFFSIIETIIL